MRARRHASIVCASIYSLWSVLALVMSWIAVNALDERPPEKSLLPPLAAGAAFAAILFLVGAVRGANRLLLFLLWIAHVGTSAAALAVTQTQGGVYVVSQVIILGAIAEVVGLAAVLLAGHRRPDSDRAKNLASQS